jgi:hypothetical protein
VVDCHTLTVLFGLTTVGLAFAAFVIVLCTRRKTGKLWKEALEELQERRNSAEKESGRRLQGESQY